MPDSRAPTVWLLFKLSALELWRNPLGMVLLLVIPTVFLATTLGTASDVSIPLKVFFGDETVVLSLTQKQSGLVFVCAAVGGFLAAYYALVLFHTDFGYFRFCAFMGLGSGTFTVARFATFLSVTGLLATLTTLVLANLVVLEQPLAVFGGFLLVTVIYGAYGGIVGVASPGILPAIMLVVLLANVDAAWLQNPVYYSAAQESALVRWLPAHFPSQVVFSAAFTQRTNSHALLGALAWAGSSLALLLLAVHLRMRGPFAGLGNSGGSDP